MAGSGKKRPLNKSSALLTQQENDAIFRLLGPDNYTLATGVAQLLAAEPPKIYEWQKKHVGVICFIKDYNEKGYFLRLYDILKNVIVWEQPFYDEFFVRQRTTENAPELVTFEGDSVVYGLNFSSKDEATNFATQVNRRYEQEVSKRYDTDKNRISAVSPPCGSSMANQLTPNVNQNHVMPPNSVNLGIPASSNHGGKAERKKKNRLTKNDIGFPTNFEHRVHVGWDPSGGFQTNSQVNDELHENIMVLLDKMGMPTNLGKKDRQMVYEIVEQFGGMDAVKKEIDQYNKPPVVSQHKRSVNKSPPQISGPVLATACTPGPVTSARNREAAPQPPPPPRNLPTRPGPPPPPVPPSQASKPATLVSNVASIPAPPPPPSSLSTLQSSQATAPSAPPLMAPAASNDFLSQISKGVALKSVSAQPEVTAAQKPAESRDAMLRDIKEGIILRPVDRQEKQRITPPEDMGGIAGALARALQERRFQMLEESDSGDENDEEEDEWED